MQYAPAVTDRSAEIYAQGSNNAANLYAQGAANMQNSLTSSFNTAMGMVNSNIQKSEENRIASDGANAKFDMLKDYKKTDGQPLFTQETIDKFDTLPLGKRQAYVQTAEAIVDDDLKRWMYSQQYNAQANRVNANMLAQQPAANQVPMSPSVNPAPATNPAPAPAPAAPYTFNPQIKTSPATPAR
jgi:hypothetical protein